MRETPDPRQEPHDAILRLPAEEGTPDSPPRVAVVTGVARGIGGATARRSGEVNDVAHAISSVHGRAREVEASLEAAVCSGGPR